MKTRIIFAVAGALLLVFVVARLSTSVTSSQPRVPVAAPAVAEANVGTARPDLAVAAPPPQRDGVTIGPNDTFVPRQTLLRFRADATAAERHAALAAVEAEPLRRVGRDGRTVLIRLPARLAVADAVDALTQNDAVEAAEPNLVYRKSVLPNDPDFGHFWGLNNTGQEGGTPDVDIDAPEAWEQSTGSPAVIVGVIDTGIDYGHPDLVANVWTNPGETPDNGLDDDGNGWVDDLRGIDTYNDDADPWDDDGHGTHVAGTIAASGNNGVGGAGVMWQAQIVSCKFLNSAGIGTLDGALACLDYFSDLKDAGIDIVLTNNSWGGGGYSRLLEERIERHGEQGMLFVAAAGNDGTNSDGLPTYPASYPADNIVSVAAIDRRGDLAWFSNFGLNSVDIAAPGVDILSAMPGGGYRLLSGTSMAAPHVSGTAGLLRANDPEIGMAEIRDRILSTGTEDPRLEGMVATGARLRIDLPIVDDDGDGMPNRWELRYGLDPLNPADALLDPDADGLSNVDEYRAGSDPTTADTDADGLPDGVEVNTWNTDPTLADTDSDGVPDGEEVNVWGSDPTSADTDGDGLADGDEIDTYGTDPTSADSDGDGLPDGWEVANGFDPLTGNEPSEDTDGDGLSDLDEYANGTDPRSADTDGDGLSDTDELNVTGTDPTDSDTDADGMADGWEVANDLDPRNPADAALDNDGDGFSNRTEYRRGTDPNDANSVPPVDPWVGDQGGAERRGFVPVVTDVSLFSRRWTRDLPGLDVTVAGLVSSGFDLLVARRGYPELTVESIDTADGSTAWDRSIPNAAAQTASLLDDAGFVLATSTLGIGHEYRVIDPDDGTTLRTMPTTGDIRVQSPAAVDSVVYAVEWDLITARRIDTGELVWQSPLLSGGFGGVTQLAANDSYVATLDSERLQVLSRDSGSLLHDLALSNCGSAARTALVLDGDAAFAVYRGCAARFDLRAGTVNWLVTPDGAAVAPPALDDDAFYVGGDSALQAFDRSTGELIWRSDVGTRYEFNVVVTLNHVFVSSYDGTFALDVGTGAAVWSDVASGRLSISDDGALLIASPYDGRLTAVNVDGDEDGDGLPNWWERYHRLDYLDPADAASDPDGDTLDNLAEFAAGTDPRAADTDADGLDDATELGVTGSDPLEADTDGDGLSDGDEVNRYGTSPLLRDTDGDQISDGDEVNVYGTDPTDPDSAPELLRSYRESFEAGRPADWTTPDDAISPFTVDDGAASDGRFSLRAGNPQVGQISAVEWRQLFAAGEFAFDVRSVDSSFRRELTVYVDDEVVEQIYRTDWRRVIVPIPSGEHVIRFEYTTRHGGTDSPGEGLWIDNVEYYVPRPFASTLDSVIGIGASTLSEFDRNYRLARKPVTLDGINVGPAITIGDNHDIYIAEPPRLHRLNPQTGEVSTTETVGWRTWAGTGLAAEGQRVFATNSDAAGGLLVFGLDGLESHRVLEPFIYIDVARGLDGYLYALRRDGYQVDRIAMSDLSIVSSVLLPEIAHHIAVNATGSIYATSWARNSLYHYAADGTLLAEIDVPGQYGPTDLVVRDNGDVVAASASGRVIAFDSTLATTLTIGPESTGSLVTAVTAVNRTGFDVDADGLADWWELAYGLDPDDASDALADADGDGLTGVDEYALATNPSLPDTDGDGLTDGDELSVYFSDPLLIDTDRDGLTDDQEVLQTLTDPANEDTDADGLDDGFEFLFLGTDPLRADSDADGIPDGFEFDNDLDPQDAADGELDPDADGLSNRREFEYGTRVDVADTDRDGLSDGAEVDVHATDPARRDSDGDSMPDGWEVRFGFAPRDPGDAEQDADGDGFDNRIEFFAGSDPVDATARPQPKPWSTHQGGPSHRGFVPLALDPSTFVEHWTIEPFDNPNYYSLGQAAAENDRVFASTADYLGYQGLAALSAETGEVLWEHTFRSQHFEWVSALSPPALADNRVYVQAGGHEDAYLYGFDADTGQMRIATPYPAQWPRLYAPAPFEADLFAYAGYYGGVGSFSGSEATLNWQADLDHYDEFSPAVDEEFVYVYSELGLSIFDRLSGFLQARIPDPGFDWRGYSGNASPIRDLSGNVIAMQGSRVVYFNVPDRSIDWIRVFDTGLVQPALMGDSLFLADGTDLVEVDVTSGSTLRRFALPEAPVGTLVVTVDFLFFATDASTYALDLSSGETVWSFPRGGVLSISPRQQLLIAGADRRLTAIRLGNDRDGDGMADEWEIEQGLDPDDPTDAGRDEDMDGLSNAEEYAAGSNPLVADTDGDGLDDSAEVRVHGTSPARSDTDGDGLNDGDEIGVHGTDPLQRDSDADGLDDGVEIAEHLTDPLAQDTDADGFDDLIEVRIGTDPTDSGAVPQRMERLTESFESGVMPMGWRTPEDSAGGWQPRSDAAWDGQFALVSDSVDISGTARTEFTAWFDQGRLDFVARIDSGGCCDKVRVTVDGDYAAEFYAGEWRPVGIYIEEGVRRIGFEFSQDRSDAAATRAAYIDRLRFFPDADYDRMDDDWERRFGLDPSTSNDMYADPDADGLGNVDEFYRETQPDNDDSDGDGMPDGWEVHFGLLPTVDDAAGDLDGDGATNLEEYAAGTDPTLPGSTPSPSPPSNPPPSNPPPSSGGGGGGGALSPTILIWLAAWFVASAGLRRYRRLASRGAAARRKRSLIASPSPVSGIGMTAMASGPSASSCLSSRYRLAAASVVSPADDKFGTPAGASGPKPSSASFAAADAAFSRTPAAGA